MARAREMGARASPMIARRPIPKRHWRSYDDAPLPTGAEALDEPRVQRVSVMVSCASPANGAVGSGCSQRHMRHSAICCSATSSRRRAGDGCGGRAARWKLPTEGGGGGGGPSEDPADRGLIHDVMALAMGPPKRPLHKAGRRKSKPRKADKGAGIDRPGARDYGRQSLVIAATELIRREQPRAVIQGLRVGHEQLARLTILRRHSGWSVMRRELIIGINVAAGLTSALVSICRTDTKTERPLRLQEAWIFHGLYPSTASLLGGAFSVPPRLFAMA